METASSKTETANATLRLGVASRRDTNIVQAGPTPSHKLG